MLKIVYCGCDYYANCLEYLTSDESVRVEKFFAGGTKGSCRRALAIAEKEGVPSTFKPISARDVRRLFEKDGCDYILSAGYPYKIPIGNHRGINVHPTLLPIGRGAWPFPRIILDGYSESGVTLHKLTDQFDVGDVVLQERFPLAKNETLDSLHRKNQALGLELVKVWTTNHVSLWNEATPQGDGEYWKRPSRKDRTLLFSADAERVDRTIRAFGSEGVFINVGCKTCLSRNASVQFGPHDYEPGQVVYLTGDWLAVAVKGGIVFAGFDEIKPLGLRQRIKRRVMGLTRFSFATSLIARLSRMQRSKTPTRR